MAELQDCRTLGELCELRARSHPTRLAVRDDEVALDYASLATRARAVAQFLGNRGVAVGDRVAVQGPNRVTWVVAAYGALLAGATLVPVSHRLPDTERSRLFDQLTPQTVILDDGINEVQGGVRFSDLESLPPVGEPLTPPCVDPATPALILSSSGTSGRIKAVPMSHQQLLRMYRDVGASLDADQEDVWLGVVPLTHSFGVNGVLLVAFLAGAGVRLLPDYHPERLARLLRTERVTVLAGPPTIYHDLARIRSSAAASPPRLGIVGSTEVRGLEIAGLARRLGIARIVVGYGMTETCGTVAIGDLPAHSADPLSWMTPLHGVEVRIRDRSDGSTLPPGRPGNVQVRGYLVCRPYGDVPDLEPGAWLDTGDVGELDQANRLAIVGRTDDMVIVSGYNVYPHEVESVLARCPGVSQIAVVGVPDPRRGQRLVGCVVAGRFPPTSAELTTFARARLSPHQVPGEYVFVDGLPLTRTDKVSREALRRRIQEAPDVSTA